MRAYMRQYRAKARSGALIRHVFSGAERRAIMADYFAGDSVDDIAAKFGCHRSYPGMLVRRLGEGGRIERSAITAQERERLIAARKARRIPTPRLAASVSDSAILQWLGGRDTGLSSAAIALTALGAMPKGYVGHPDHPHDAGDFGRCYRLLQACPEARVGLDRLGRDGGFAWQKLVPRWSEIEAAYLHDKRLSESGKIVMKADWKCCKLIQKIILPMGQEGTGHPHTNRARARQRGP